jgi:hypothetical protein
MCVGAMTVAATEVVRLALSSKVASSSILFQGSHGLDCSSLGFKSCSHMPGMPSLRSSVANVADMGDMGVQRLAGLPVASGTSVFQGS